MNLTKAQAGTEYIISDIVTDDEDLNAFLFTLGGNSGEPITGIAKRKNNYTVVIKNGRYNIDDQLASAIEI